MNRGYTHAIKYDRDHQKTKAIRLKGLAYKRLQLSVLKRDGYRCQMCGCHTVAPPHHIIFRSHGGPDTEENLITLCIGCHDIPHGRKLMIMPWGKFKGKEIEDLPSSYLRWLAENIGEDTFQRKQICVSADKEYQFRERTSGHFED